MLSRLQKCIRNNTALYESVFRLLGVSFEKTGHIWCSLEQTPPLYSNIVTLLPEWRPDDIFHEIDSRFEAEGWDKWGIKDSFGVLDLTEYGLTKLFDAKWICLDISKFEPVAGGGLRYEVVRDADSLAAWRLAWDADEQLGKSIFSDAMLDNPDVWFIAGYKGDSILSGCLVNASDDVLGISNFFGPGEGWSDIILFIRDSIRPVDIVGYERDFENLRELGFETPGDLRVWVKTGQNRER